MQVTTYMRKSLYTIPFKISNSEMKYDFCFTNP